MKTLYLIRHAKSSWEFDVPDDQRPLNKRGSKDADLIGKKLKTLVKPIDKILCSPAERTHSTAKIILNNLEIDHEVLRLEPDLYDFGGHKVMDVIKRCDPNVDTLMIFGHNHAFTSLTNMLGSEKIDNLPTAGVVGIEFDVEEWGEVSVGKTLLIIFPKMFKK